MNSPKLILCAALSLAAFPLLAQRREPDPHDVEAGSQRYLAVCTACHGADGDQVPGVDLGHNKFRRATTDDDLVKIIRNGIPGTGMPANAMSEAAAGAVVTYLHSLAESANRNTSKGDPARGKLLFEGSAGCTGCHRVDGAGSHLGPDLSEIGRLRRSADLETSILDPDAEIAPSNRFVKIVTRDNTTVTGRMMNHDSFTVQIMDPKEHLRSFDMSGVKEFTFVEHSTMPSYRGKLSAQELADITSYLTTLKGSR